MKFRFITALVLSAWFAFSTAPRAALGSEETTKIPLGDMKGWPGGPRVGVSVGSTVELNLRFDLPSSRDKVICMELYLHLYSKTDSPFDEAIVDDIQLNEYIIENDWKLIWAHAWGGAEKDEWTSWNVPVEFVKSGENLLIIKLFLKGDGECEFYLYDTSYVEIGVQQITVPVTTTSRATEGTTITQTVSTTTMTTTKSTATWVTVTEKSTKTTTSVSFATETVTSETTMSVHPTFWDRYGTYILTAAVAGLLLGVVLYVFRSTRQEKRKRCPYCKREIPEDAKFCGFCGEKL